MTENRELRSQSENTNFQVEVEPLLQPHRATITAPKAELRKRFDDYFHVHEAEFIKQYDIKGQKIKGGKIKNAQKILEGSVDVNSLYPEVLHQCLTEHIEDVFFIEGFRVLDFDDDRTEECRIVAKIFYYPKLEMTGEIDYSCPTPVKQSEEAAWEDKCKELQHKHKYTEEYESDDLTEDGLEVLLDLIVSDDKHTLRRKWLELSHLPSSLQEEIKKAKKGDMFQTKYSVFDVEDEDVEKTELDATVKIYDARKVIRPEVDDELAKKEDFESLEQLRNQFAADFDEYLENAKRAAAADHIIFQITHKSQVPHLPEIMLERRASELVDMFVQRFGNAENAMAAGQVESLDELATKLRPRVIADILSMLAFRHYAEMHSLPIKEKVILDHLVDSIEWKETL
jgi:hypothetical protein